MNQILDTHFAKRLVECILIVFLIIGFPVLSLAQESQLRFYVTPEFSENQVDDSKRYFDLNLEPGETEALEVTLQNASTEKIQVAITPHTAYTNVHGVVEYGKDASDPDPTLIHSLSDLIETPEVIELSGNETKTIEIPLRMPQEVFEGFLAGGLRIAEVREETETTEESGEGVAIENEFAYVLGIIVSNKRDSVLPGLNLLDVFADQLNYRNVISATLQNVAPAFINRMSVEASVYKEGEDDVLYEAQAEQLQMAPNSHFHFPISLEGDRFQSGNYILRLKAISGEDEWEWERPFTIEGETARALNRQDVTLDSTPNWLLIGGIFFISCLLAIIVYLIVQVNTNKQTQEKEE